MAISLGDIFVAIRGETRGLDETFRNVTSRSREFASSISSLLSGAFSFALGGLIEKGLGAIAGGFGAIKDEMISGNAAFEGYETSFGTLIGNAELARQRMSELALFGATTPFELPGVVNADKILQSFGLHAADVAGRFGKTGEEIRRITGDVAAGADVAFEELSKYLGQFSSGSTGEALARFEELGIVTREQLRGMGLEFAKSGELLSPVNEAMTVLLQTMDDRFGGMMDAQSKTLNGMLSNFEDWKSNTLRVLGAPFFDRFKAGLETVLSFLEPGGAVDNAIQNLATTFDLLLGVAQDVGSALLGDVGGSIEGFVELVNEKIQQANEFLRQLRDEIAGLTAGDILSELGPGLADLDAKMMESLDQLKARHQETVDSINGQLANAASSLETALGDIGAKFGPKIEAINERFAKSIASTTKRIADSIQKFNEETTERSEEHAKKRAKIEAQIAKEQAKSEEKLTDLKKDHARRRAGLAQQLMFAESEEQFLQIQSQIAAEDEKFADSVDKEKKANKGKADELKDRLKEEDAEFSKAEAKRQKQHAREVADLQANLSEQKKERNKALAEVEAERAAEEAAVRQTYDEQVKLLNNKLEAENAAFADSQVSIVAMFAEQMAAMEAEIQARADAIGQGPAAKVGAFIRDAIAWVNELKAVVGAFLSEHADALIAFFTGVAAVLLGGGVIAAITALVGILSGISLPILAIVGAVGLLAVAWQQNWFGIQEITAQVWEFITTTTQNALDSINAWWQQHGQAIMTIVNMAMETVTGYIQGSLEFLKFLWANHGDGVMEILTLFWDNVKIILDTAFQMFGEWMDLLAALINGDWQQVWESALNIISLAWTAISDLFSNSTQAILAVVREFIQLVIGEFKAPDWSSLGSNILDGILGGLKSKVGNIGSSVKDAVGGLLKGAQSALGIGSPSKLFSDEVGAPVGQGVLGGMVDEIKANAKKMADDAVKPMIGALKPAVEKISGPTITMQQTNHFPQAPAGFNSEDLLNKVDERTAAMLLEYSLS